ncbi:MAG: CYTH domain-containing protein [Ktedonobacteraceae bacterium]|nr:CYTH domain-containing protein [Ktedonobacteraceae bacterium]
MIEVELKFALPADVRAPLQARLDALPSLRRLMPVENVDIYYDTSDFACLQQAVFLRIRDSDRLEIKYHEQDDPTHTHATEQTFPLMAEAFLMQDLNTLCSRFIPDWRHGDTVKDALVINDLRAFVSIEKRRARYVNEQLSLCLDQVADLGDFFEAELLCADETGIEQAQAQLEAFVADLALPALSLVRVGYVELWLRSHLPQVYRLGKYQVENAVPVSASAPMRKDAFMQKRG